MIILGINETSHDASVSLIKNEEILLGVFVPLVSKEDAILSKLIWISKGSNKSRQDVRMMLKRRGVIDFDYLNVQATKLGVESILKESRIEYRRGMAGGGNQLRQPYLKKYKINQVATDFPVVEHIHFFSWYIGNNEQVTEYQINRLCKSLSSENLL